MNTLGLPWSTGDVQLDNWLLGMFGQWPETLDRLAGVGEWQERRKISMNLRSRPHIRSPKPYFEACIARSHSNGRPPAAGAPLQGVPLDRMRVGEVARPPVPEPPSKRPRVDGQSPSAGASGGASAASASSAVPAAASPVSSPAVRPAEPMAEFDEWAVKLFRGHDSKASLVKGVAARLQGSLAEQMMRLPLDWQVPLCSALLLMSNRPAGMDSIACRFIGSYARLQELAQQPCPSPSTASEVISVVVLFVGALSGVQVMSLQGALTYMQHVSRGTTLRVIDSQSFPCSTPAAALERHTKWKKAIKHGISDGTAMMVDWIRRHKAGWGRSEARVLIVTALDGVCTDYCVRRGAVAPIARVATAGDTVASHTAQAFRALGPEISSDRIHLFSWSACQFEVMDNTNLAHLLGASFTGDPWVYGSPQAVFQFWSKPACPGVQVRTKGGDWGAAVGGWRWGPAAKVGQGEQPSQRIMPGVARLREEHLILPREWTPEEADAIAGHVAVHDETGTEALVSIEMVGKLLGHTDLVELSGLEGSMPCSRHCIGHTGGPCEPSHPHACKCGSTVRCSTCEAVIQTLLSSPHAGMLCDYMTAWVVAALGSSAPQATPCRAEVIAASEGDGP